MLVAKLRYTNLPIHIEPPMHRLHLLILFYPQAVPKGEHLAKYARNLTKEAMAGKLDPVIGRDDVIRRVVQVRPICAKLSFHIFLRTW